LTKNISTDRWYLRLTANERTTEYGEATKSFITALPVSHRDLFLNPQQGSTIILYPLKEDLIKYRITPEKLSNFLSEDLRDRLHNINLTISYYSGNKLKSIQVKPISFRDIPIINKTFRFQSFSPIKVNIHLLGSHESDFQPVMICKDGTKVTNTVYLDEFNR
jgi:hypothetical protein